MNPVLPLGLHRLPYRFALPVALVPLVLKLLYLALDFEF